MFDFKNIKIKAVLLSFLTYFGITIVLGIVLSLFTSIPMMKEYDMSDPEQQKLMQAALMEDTTYMVGTIVMTLIGAFVAGIVAGKVAKVAEVTNAFVTGAVLLLVGLLFVFFASTPIPWSITLISWIVLFGGLYAGAMLVMPESAETNA